MTKKNIAEKFFFASDDSKYYDDTIELTVPRYRLIHRTMIDLLNCYFKVQLNNKYRDAKGIILDVGAGSGNESIRIMKQFSKMNTLAIDLCEPMKNLYERNYNDRINRSGNKEEKRFQYVVEDIRRINKDDERIDAYYKSLNQSACKVAISAYCIHHYSLEEKNAIYQKMYDLLEPGGILIIMDLFTYGSEQISQDAHSFDIEFIKREFDNPSFKKSELIPKEQRERLKHKWVNHMETAHCLEPVEQRIEILKEMRFENVECVLKYWQQGVIRATKPTK